LARVGDCEGMGRGQGSGLIKARTDYINCLKKACFDPKVDCEDLRKKKEKICNAAQGVNDVFD